MSLSYFLVDSMILGIPWFVAAELQSLPLSSCGSSQGLLPCISVYLFLFCLLQGHLSLDLRTTLIQDDLIQRSLN